MNLIFPTICIELHEDESLKLNGLKIVGSRQRFDVGVGVVAGSFDSTDKYDMNSIAGRGVWMFDKHVQGECFAVMKPCGDHCILHRRKIVWAYENIYVLCSTQCGFIDLGDPSPYGMSADDCIRYLGILQDSYGFPQAFIDFFHSSLHPGP